MVGTLVKNRTKGPEIDDFSTKSTEFRMFSARFSGLVGFFSLVGLQSRLPWGFRGSHGMGPAAFSWSSFPLACYLNWPGQFWGRAVFPWCWGALLCAIVLRGFFALVCSGVLLLVLPGFLVYITVTAAAAVFDT